MKSDMFINGQGFIDANMFSYKKNSIASCQKIKLFDNDKSQQF
jgi:hypothetical protein